MRLGRVVNCRCVDDLVEYNPNSSLLAMEKIRQLSFASQVKVFRTGFGMWQENVRTAIHE
jgi:hypothetical protein